jgi:hypothetical protein
VTRIADVVVHDHHPSAGPRHILRRVADEIVAVPIAEADVEPLPPKPGAELRGLYEGGPFSIGVMKSFVGSDWSGDGSEK